MSRSFCNNVITIPQYQGTCWFNALLMMFFYSQYSRKLLLNRKPFNTATDISRIIFKTLLNKQYIKNKNFNTYFLYNSPMYILKHLPFLTKDEFKYIKHKGYNAIYFIHRFLSYINIKHLVLDYIDDNFYIGYTENLNTNVYKNTIKPFFILRKNIDLIIDDYKNKIQDERPDYIVVNMYDKSSYGSFNMLSKNITDKLNFKSFNTHISGLSSLKNEIIFKGNKYILDSCYLANFNKKNIDKGHAIAGITCKNNKYVYNGWFRLSKDPALNNNVYDNMLPCELMSFDWNVNSQNNEFCLNVNACSLDKIVDKKTYKEQLCFDFAKGNRVLIYVLADSSFKSQDINSSSASIKFNSGISSSSSPIIKKKEPKRETKKETKKEPKICPDGKILNPITGRCIKIKPVKKEPLKKTTTKIINEPKICPDDKILNPATNRCVLKSGKIGKLLLKK